MFYRLSESSAVLDELYEEPGGLAKMIHRTGWQPLHYLHDQLIGKSADRALDFVPQRCDPPRILPVGRYLVRALRDIALGSIDTLSAELLLFTFVVTSISTPLTDLLALAFVVTSATAPCHDEDKRRLAERYNPTMLI